MVNGLGRMRAFAMYTTLLLDKELASGDEQVRADSAELVALRATVAGFHDAAAAADPVNCDPEQICSYL